MVLVLGGIASGKRTYLRSLGYDGELVGTTVGADEPALYGLEEALRKGPLTDEELALVADKAIVACCEVGLGVVPMDADERAWRERVGRTCCALATRAERVVRMVCGIPVIVK